MKKIYCSSFFVLSCKILLFYTSTYREQFIKDNKGNIHNFDNNGNNKHHSLISIQNDRIQFLTNKNTKRMKHLSIKSITAIMVAAILFAACDPGFNEDIAIRNSSSVEVTITPSPYHRATQDSLVNGNSGTPGIQPVTIAAGDHSILVTDGGLGASSLEFGQQMFQYYFNDSVVFSFADGRKVVYHSYDTTGISPYNFSSSCYTYEEKHNKTAPFKGLAYYGCLTFTITEANHDAAQ